MALVQTRHRATWLTRRAMAADWRLLRWSAAAGGLGGLIGWALGEPLNGAQIATSATGVYANVFAYFLVISAAIGAVLGALPGVRNRSRRQAVRGALTGCVVGGIGGGLGGLPAQFVFHALGEGLLARAAGWGIVAAIIGLCPGAATRDRRRALRGIAGGALGGFVGGLLFNLVGSILPQSSTDTGTANRLIADLAVGLCVGLAVALVEVVMKKAWLTVVDGKRAGAQFILSKETTTIGRDDRDDVILWGDPWLANGHVHITRRDGRYLLDGHGVDAPTRLNGQPVFGTAALHDGDLIAVGGTQLAFHARGVPPAQDRVPVPRRQVAAAAPHVVATGVAPQQALAAALPAAAVDAGAPARDAVGVLDTPGVPAVPFYLVGLTPPGYAQSLPRRSRVTIGRDESNDVVLDEPSASAHHAELRWEHGHWVVYDLGSTNGTFVSYRGESDAERRVTQNALRSGSTVRFGQTALRLEQE